MGRKRAEAVAEPQQDEASAGSSPKLAEVVRNALGALGVEASGADVTGWIAVHYPGYKYNPTTLVPTISNQRKKLRGDSDSVPTRRSFGAVPAAPVQSAPTVDDLLRVSEIAAENGGAEELLKLVQTVSDLSEEVGGIDKLLRCLLVLRKLAGA